MDYSPGAMKLSLTAKIARLVTEGGWTLEEFARRANLNRLTVRHMLREGTRQPRQATVAACARALGISVQDLTEQPVEDLAARVRLGRNGPALPMSRLYEQAGQPELLAWMERHPDQAAQLTPADVDELLSLQGTGGPLTGFGVQYFVDVLQRRRRLRAQVDVIAGTEHFELLEKIVQLLFEKIQPYRDRRPRPPDQEGDQTRSC